MIWPSTALLLCGAVLSVAVLARCAADNPPPAGEPTFYQDLAKPDGALDAAAAQSMISGYRGNNGLPAVTVDPELMRLASEQAHAMAAHDKMDHDIGRPFQERIRNSRLPRPRRGREHLRRLPHVRRGIFRLARFAAAPRQHAQRQRHPHGHRRGLRAEVEIQGVLGAHPRRRRSRADSLGRVLINTRCERARCAHRRSFPRKRESSRICRSAVRCAHSVIAGLDPAIHADASLARIDRTDSVRRISAWTTGSSPVVTNKGSSPE